MSTNERVFNFSAGPAVLPLPVLEEAQRDLVCYPGGGASVMELSHRGKVIDGIITEAEQRMRRLLGIPENYHVLFLQGGATTQFSMVPMNFLAKSACYMEQGTWSKKAMAEAKRVGEVKCVWSGKEGGFKHIPTDDEYEVDPSADYFHICGNETIHGLEFHRTPKTNGVPLICDASSEFLSRPVDVSKYAMIYAGAQKNVGPAGVTIVVLSDDFYQKKLVSDDKTPIMLNYKTHVDGKSLYNTAPVWAIYMVGLVMKWLENDMGGLQGIYDLNKKKAELLYNAIDASDGYYAGHADKESRSIMNVTFRMANEDLEKAFAKEAEAAGMIGLKGHRSVGGLRASIYNAFPYEGVERLVEFMAEFKKNH